MSPDDAPHAFELNNDPKVIRYTGDSPFESEDAARIFLENYSDYEKFNMGRWAVIRKEDEQWLGWCGLKYLPENNEVDLGYRFHRRYWGHGYATETSLACIQYGFEKLKLNRIIGRVEKANYASVRVLEKCKMNFFRHIDFNGKPGSIYEKLKTNG
jgi:[ribosomal protein S5]-alanine N-acetyltransferase